MKNFYKYLIIILLSLFLPLAGCDDDSDDNKKYNFKIMASNGNATGYYSLNGDEFKYFETEYSENSTFYSYEKDISSLKTIMIYTEGVGTETSSISIYLYEDDELLDSVSASQTDSDVRVSVTLNYTKPDEDEDDTE